MRLIKFHDLNDNKPININLQSITYVTPYKTGCQIGIGMAGFAVRESYDEVMDKIAQLTYEV